MTMKISKAINEKSSVHFFKIIQASCIHDQRLEIPKQFTRNLEKILPSTAVLQVPSGREWPVDIKEDEGHFWFQNGLHDFMEYYSICAGHFLFFNYDGQSRFNVVIFDMTASEIQYPFEINDLEESDNADGSSLKQASEDEDIVEIMELSTMNVIDQPNAHKVHRNCNACVAFERQNKMDSGVGQKKNGGHDPKMKQGENCRKKRKLSDCNQMDKRANDGTVPVSKRHDNGTGSKPDLYPQKNYDVTMSAPPGFKSIADESDVLYPVKGSEGQMESLPSFPHMPFQKNCNRTTTTKAVEVISLGESSAIQVKRPTELLIVPKTYASLRKKEEAFIATMAYMFKNPYCPIAMRPSYVEEQFILNIPHRFGKLHLRDGVITLRVPHGSTWQVRCSFGSYYVKLLKGWRAFVLDNHLEEGDICFFELVDRKYIELNVSIFRVHHHPKSISPSFTSRFAAAQQKERAIMAALAYASANPFCTVTKHPTHVNISYRLNIPTAFAKKYLKNGFEGITLRVLDGGMCHAERDTGEFRIINKGWKAFVSDNYLEDEDVCIFQLVDWEHIEVKVSIFRDFKLLKNSPHHLPTLHLE